jgi:hypothetical protein
MSTDDKGRGLKSSYELALERLESQGIERPDAEGVSLEVRERIAEIRNQAEASLAELEILHRDRLKRPAGPEAREEQERSYRDERERIQRQRDRKIADLRGDRAQ